MRGNSGLAWLPSAPPCLSYQKKEAALSGGFVKNHFPRNLFPTTEDHQRSITETRQREAGRLGNRSNQQRTAVTATHGKGPDRPVALRALHRWVGNAAAKRELEYRGRSPVRSDRRS